MAWIEKKTVGTRQVPVNTDVGTDEDPVFGVVLNDWEHLTAEEQQELIQLLGANGKVEISKFAGYVTINKE